MDSSASCCGSMLLATRSKEGRTQLEVERCILLTEKTDDHLSTSSNGIIATNDDKTLIYTAACSLSKMELYINSLF
jgi:hypothetical protein